MTAPGWPTATTPLTARDLERWVADAHDALGRRRIGVWFGRGAAIDGPPAVWVSLTSPRGTGRLVLDHDGVAIEAHAFADGGSLGREHHDEATVEQLAALVDRLDPG